MAKHNERCDKCKNAISQMLGSVYGCTPHWEHCWEVFTRPEDYADTPFGRDLKRIYKALQRHRGNLEFVRSNTIRRCDLFIPNGRFIVELDESQHFTEARKVSLKAYPPDLKLGYSLDKWVNLCKEFNAHDNDPPYRDEQRAWYDTLRDFVPLVHGLKPTVRICLRDHKWCDLDPNSFDDKKFFVKSIGLKKRIANV